MMLLSRSSRLSSHTVCFLFLLLAAASSVVDGFIMPTNQQQKSIFTPTITTTTALPAGPNLFDRFTRVVKGNMNTFIKAWEDPEKVMNQALDDMQSDLIKVRQTYAEVSATQRRLNTRKLQYETVAADWYRRAQLALENGKEPLAKEALTRREEALQEAMATQEQMDTQSVSIDKLYEGMQALESKILDAKSKKDQMIARAKTAKSTQKVNDMLSGLTGKTSMDAFNRMEEKVMALEAAAEASAEGTTTLLLTTASGTQQQNKGSSSSSDVEMQFRLLEASDAVEKELEKLKETMVLPEKSSISTTKTTTSTTTTVKTPTSRHVLLNN